LKIVGNHPPFRQVRSGLPHDGHLGRGSGIGQAGNAAFDLGQRVIGILPGGGHLGEQSGVRRRVCEQRVADNRAFKADFIQCREQQGVDVDTALHAAGQMVFHHHLRQHPATETDGQCRDRGHANQEQSTYLHTDFWFSPPTRF